MKLKEQVAAVLRSRADYEEAAAYYEGLNPESFATAKVRRALRTSGENGGLNYCRTVVDSVNNRLEIAAVNSPSDEAQNFINTLWEDNELGHEIGPIHLATLEFGDTYAIVWPDEDGKDRVSHNSPLTTALVYDKENPSKKAFGVKVWKETDRLRMNVYTKDSLTRLSANGDHMDVETEWSVMETVESPYDDVPVFHFRTHRPYGRPEHLDAYPAQDAINKQFINSMVVADYQAFPQRYLLASLGDEGITPPDHKENDTDRENEGSLKGEPGSVWTLFGFDKAGEFKPADPDVFWGPIHHSVEAMASITNTPLHYFDAGKGNATGQARRVAEAPLLKKVKDRRNSLSVTWRELFVFLLRNAGIDADVEVKWIEVESLDELERWDVMLKKINAGLSHRQALREGGYDEENIEKIMAERQEEAAAGLYYQRAPQTRVNTENDETNAVETEIN